MLYKWFRLSNTNKLTSVPRANERTSVFSQKIWVSPTLGNWLIPAFYVNKSKNTQKQPFLPENSRTSSSLVFTQWVKEKTIGSANFHFLHACENWKNNNSEKGIICDQKNWFCSQESNPKCRHVSSTGSPVYSLSVLYDLTLEVILRKQASSTWGSLFFYLNILVILLVRELVCFL